MTKLTKKRRQSIEETIKFLEDKKTEYCLEAGKVKTKIVKAFEKEEIAKLHKELDDWNDLYAEAEAALLFVKTALVFEED